MTDKHGAQLSGGSDGAALGKPAATRILSISVASGAAVSSLVACAATLSVSGGSLVAAAPLGGIAIAGLATAAYLAGRTAGERSVAARMPPALPAAPSDTAEAGDLFVCRNHAGRIIAVSDSLWRLLGAAPGAFIGQDFAGFVADLKAGRLLDPGDLVAAGPSVRVDPWKALRRRLLAIAGASRPVRPEVPLAVLSGDLRLETVDGPRWFAWSDEPLRQDDAVIGIRSRGRDITPRKAIEVALEEARDQAEAASAAKSRFLAMVSHEIRTPLNGILGMTGLIMQTQLTAEQKTYARAVETSGEALLTLIEDLLDFSKIEAGRLDLQPAPVDLAAMVEELIELLAPRAYAKGIELAAYVDPALPPLVLADPVRLKQVLFNLAGNGIKFTGEGGVAIEVLTMGADDGRTAIHFQVRDTGIGIAAGDQERIFGEFEQAEPGPARAYGGTGLGLAIARQLVRLMGGDIRLESTPGAGACFSFTVRLAIDADIVRPSEPVAAAPEAVTADGLSGARAALARLEASFVQPAVARRPVPPPPPSAIRVLEGRRILVVSHALIEGPMVLRRLFDAGADVTLATQKDLEVELAGAWRPDAILVDAAAGDAVALIDRIRSVTDTPAGVLIVPNERAMLGELQQAGYGAYLVKPVRARSLIAVVRTLIGEAGFAASEPVKAAPEPVVPAHRLSVLLCDDNEINLLLGRSLMEKLGHRVTVAGDGRRAIQIVTAAIANGEAPFDVILMDVHMPEVDGIEAARRIRVLLADAGVAATRLVALTADAVPETRAGCEDGLFDDWLAKPLQPADLERSLDRAAAFAHAS